MGCYRRNAVFEARCILILFTLNPDYRTATVYNVDTDRDMLKDI